MRSGRYGINSLYRRVRRTHIITTTEAVAVVLHVYYNSGNNNNVRNVLNINNTFRMHVP